MALVDRRALTRTNYYCNILNLLYISILPDFCHSRSKVIDIRAEAHVHHPQYGVGKVQSIRKRSFGGHEEATYAQLYFEREDLVFTILKRDLPTTVRKLVTTREAGRLLDHINDWDGEAKPNWKARAESHQAAIRGGDPFEYAKVAKELTRMGRAEDLRPRDKANLTQAVSMLTEELSRVLKKPPARAGKLVQEALQD